MTGLFFLAGAGLTFALIISGKGPAFVEALRAGEFDQQDITRFKKVLFMALALALLYLISPVAGYDYALLILMIMAGFAIQKGKLQFKE